jgi:hypothetical protein
MAVSVSIAESIAVFLARREAVKNETGQAFE